MTDPSTDDHELVRACRAGNAEAFGELVLRYQDRLYPTIFRLVGSEEDSRDVLQDAFVRAFTKLDLFQGTSSFYTWIYRIAVNQAVNFHRRRSPRLINLPEIERGGDIATALEEPSRELDPAERLDRAERDELIQKALSRLSVEHRAVVILKDLEDHRYEEIAEILDIPVGTVRSRLHRARCELREFLGDLFADERPPNHPGSPRGPDSGQHRNSPLTS